MAGGTRATTIDGYLSGVSAEQRAALEDLRQVIREAAPDAEECISYGVPAFRQNGMLVGFGATGNRCAFYLMNGTGVAAHAHELSGYDTSKGTIRFDPDEPLPAPLVGKLVNARLAENAEKRKKKSGAPSDQGESSRLPADE